MIPQLEAEFRKQAEALAAGKSPDVPHKIRAWEQINGQSRSYAQQKDELTLGVLLYLKPFGGWFDARFHYTRPIGGDQWLLVQTDAVEER